MSSGKEVKAAFKKAATWGTPVAVGGSDAFLVISESISRSREHLPDDSAGQAFHAQSDQGLITCGGDVSAYLRYSGLETLLAMALGTAGAPVQQETTTAYLHSLVPAGGVDGLFGTLAVYKGFSCHEHPSCKIDGFTLEGEAGQPVKITFNTICDDVNINTASGTNTASAMAALADPAAGNRVLFRQAEFLITDQEGAALAAGDAISPSRFSLGFKRGLAGDHVAGNNDRITEPTYNAFPEVSLELEFPSYTSDTYLNDLGADTRKKMSIAFTGSNIEGSYNHKLEILIPHMVLTNAEAAVNGAGKITHPVTASLLAAESAPDGMSGVTTPFVMNLTTTLATDPLI